MPMMSALRDGVRPMASANMTTVAGVCNEIVEALTRRGHDVKTVVTEYTDVLDVQRAVLAVTGENGELYHLEVSRG